MTPVQSPPLYKRTTKGAIQTWWMEQAADCYRTVSGQLDGAKVTSEWTVAKPKNTGKANATTGEEQAAKEIEAQYKKKLAQGGYFTDVNFIDGETYFKPMLANKYDDLKNNTNFFDGTWGSQRKMDGLRLIISRKGAFARQGKSVATVAHITEALAPVFDWFEKSFGHTNVVFDGELYNHRFKDDFNELVSIAKKQEPTEEELVECRKFLQFHVYDIGGSPIGNLGYSSRHAWFAKIREEFENIEPLVKFLPNDLFRTQEDLDKLYEMYLEEGFEGQMLRKLTAKYQNKRTNDLLKRKTFIDCELKIVGVNEGKGNRSGQVGAFVLALEWEAKDRDGNPVYTVNGTPKGTNKYRRQLWLNRDKLIGKSVTLRYFNLTPGNVPRFPVVVTVHETERW